MSSFTLIVLIGIAGWLAWRYYVVPAQKRMAGRRPPAPPRPSETPPRARVSEATTLEKDPQTGVYRPVDRAD